MTHITLPRDVLEQAIEALQNEIDLNTLQDISVQSTEEAITALRTALEAPAAQKETEWIIGDRVPRIEGKLFQVQTQTDDVRIVEYRPDRDYWSLWFTDCTSPWQNAICTDGLIKAWREQKHD